MLQYSKIFLRNLKILSLTQRIHFKHILLVLPLLKRLISAILDHALEIQK